MLTTFLKSYFKVYCANDGLEALNIFYSNNIDLIIADIMMPRMDGFMLLRTLRSQQCDVPVLFLTAKHTIEDKREGFSLGADDYMTKPINLEELLLRINALLRRARITREKR